ncbi:hypothetical protein RchiOBHm_Chr5g0062901 [Rosa chinensis]|uniref:Uncharacterized protein n=1 Tax=Rosa chinensis TaxID=74649 RepID=A0A2P6QI99_ROSCH|nr:hypothetical protein RchiOBHm_Chr5g0062901 [Rosa chinensis]
MLNSQFSQHYGLWRRQHFSRCGEGGRRAGSETICYDEIEALVGRRVWRSNLGSSSNPPFLVRERSSPKPPSLTLTTPFFVRLCLWSYLIFNYLCVVHFD